MPETLQQLENSILLNRQFQNFSNIQASLSSSTNSFTSIQQSLTSRLEISNSLNQDIILPINYYNLGESFYWRGAYEYTKIALYNIIQNYPIGISGSSTSNLYLENIEEANNFISTLSPYDFFLLQQLCGWTLTNSGMTITASATGISTSLSADLSISSANIYILPVLNRDINNYLLWPQGVNDSITLDSYYSDLLDENKDIDQQINNFDGQSFFEQILTTAIAFDEGFVKIYKGWTSGTGSDYFNISSATGMAESYILPEVLLKNINRNYAFQNIVSPALFQNDYRNNLVRYLNSVATVFDEVKQLIDGLKTIYRNYWGNFNKLPQSYIQELIAREWGIELFSSSQREIVDNLKVRGSYLTDTQITFQFWNRILCSLVSILKSKGTIESIKKTVRAYGLPSTLIQIYELASYKSFATGFYNESSNHAIAKFRPNVNINPYNKVFQSVSADLTNQSISSSALSIHSKICFFDDLFDGSRDELSGTIYNLNPNQLSLQYKFIGDNDNISTSGYPYIQFILSSGTETLSSNYNFIKNNLNQNYGFSQGTGYFSLISGRDKNELFMQLGFVPSNYEYFDPIISSITGSANSLSATYLSPTGVVVGSITNTPNINLGNFYLQEIGMNTNHINNLVLDSDYLASPSGYNSNILAWKFNEYVNLDVNGKNFILDSTTAGITGQPTFYGVSGNPYDYVFDDPNFFNDNIPGFKLQKMYNAKTEALIDKNLRVGISLASPIDTFIHNMFGSRFGELYANPNDFYNYSLTDTNATYSLTNSKNDELYLAAGAQKSDVNISEFLKYLNRIGGHLGSLFQFVEQVIPVSKRILEKGIIIENPISNRFIITKTEIQENHNLESDGTIDGIVYAVGYNDENLNADLNGKPYLNASENDFSNINLNQNVNLNGSISNLNETNAVINDVITTPASGSLIGNFLNTSIIEQFVNESSFSQSLTAFISTNRNIIKSTIQNPQVQYIPEKLINETTIFNLQPSKIDLDNLQQNDSLQYQIPQHALTGGQFFTHLNFDNSLKLLSTSLTADESAKKFVGTIHIEDITGRRVQTNFNAVRINMGAALYNGLNAVNVIINGEYLPWNTQVKDFPVNSLSGVSFEINTIGSIVDGLSLGKQISVLFQDLMNPTDTGSSLQFILDYNMEQYSSNTGVGIN